MLLKEVNNVLPQGAQADDAVPAVYIQKIIRLYYEIKIRPATLIDRYLHFAGKILSSKRQ